ncbi:zinc-binding dehydrogenase [Corallococcus sp. AB018]|uniref:zinc-binding dehydrogenase n=2 Tax=Corallococcus TaxID=83461 RepID=UPI0027D2990C|nr:zinc-binding dehydrogenase [Corallococcus sp. AB018]
MRSSTSTWGWRWAKRSRMGVTTVDREMVGTDSRTRPVTSLALGAHVTVFSHMDRKKQDALRMGAHEVVVSSRPEEMAAKANSLDFILDTVSAAHDVNAYLELLRRDGHLVLVGFPARPLEVAPLSLLSRRASFSGSGTGGLPETQAMLDFCGEHGIVSDIELIPIQGINEAFTRLEKGDVKYRFVIDLKSLG